MKRIAMIAALLAVVAGPSWAQNYMLGSHLGTHYRGQAIGGYSSADTSFIGAKMSTTGGLSIYDEDRDRDKFTLWRDVISNASLAAAALDSSGTSYTDVHAYRYLKLLIKAVPIGAAANTTVRLAFQFREVMDGILDSTNTVPEYMYGRSDVGVLSGTTGVDTTFSGHLVTGTVSLPWSGEYVVTFNMNRSAPASAVAANIASYPNMVGISLDSIFGRPMRFAKLNIRVRNLNISGPAVKLNVSLLGFAQ